MKTTSRIHRFAPLRSGALLTTFTLLAKLALPASAQSTAYWDPSATGNTSSFNSTSASGGNGNWDTTDSFWYINDTTFGPVDETWTNGSTYIASFGGTAGTVTLTSAIEAAGLVFTTSGYTIATGSNTLQLDGSGINTNALSSGTTTITGNVALGAAQTWTVGSGSTLAVSAAVSGAQALTETGSGTLTLSGNNTYSGGTTISSGGTLTVGGSGLLGGGSYAGAIANSGTFNYASSGSQTLSGIISGTGALNVSAGTLILTGTNTYSGNTTVSAGTLQIGNASANSSAFGAAGSTVTVGGSGTLAFTVGSSGYDAFAHNFVFNTGATVTTVDGYVTFGSASNNTASNSYTITFNGTTTLSPLWNGKSFFLAGIVQGSGAINIVRPVNGSYEVGSVAFLNNNNTYSGTITTSGTYGANGTMSEVIVGTANTLQYASIVNNAVANTNTSHGESDINSRSGLIFNTTTANLGSLSGSGNFILGQNTAAIGTSASANETNTSTGVALTLGSNNTSTTYSGVISGLGSITKVGTGTFTLSGANTFSGGVTVSAGGVAAGNASALGTGAVTINGGTFSSTVNLTGLTGFTLSSGKWSVSLGSSSVSTGGITGSGTFSITGGTLDLSSSSSISYSTTYTILSGLTGSVSGLTITGYDTADYIASLSSSGVLSFASAIPEPATCAAFLGLGVLGFVAWRRRRCIR